MRVRGSLLLAWAPLVVLALLGACEGSAGTADVGVGLDLGAAGELVGTPDLAGEPDSGAPTAPDLLQVPDLVPAPDLFVRDLGAGLPDLPDLGSVEERAYSRCDTDADCPAGLRCLTGRNNPLYGQCTRPCLSEADCPLSPYGNGVVCQYEMCVMTCGVQGGDCPDWLECVSQQYCLEPVSTQSELGPGESCRESAECVQPAECVEGEFTQAYCAPLCESDADCLAAAPEASGICSAVGGSFNFCIFYCGMMGQNKPCPGDLVCEAVVCR